MHPAGMGLLSWWRGIWSDDRRAQRAAAESYTAWGDQLRLLVGTTPPRRGSAELLKAFAESPWLHAVVQRRAEALSSVEWIVYRRKAGRRARGLPGNRSRALDQRHRSLDMLLEAGELERLEEHPLLDLLWQPNPMHTGVGFWALVSKYMDLVGETFHGIERPAASQAPSAVWPIVPTWVRDVPSARGNYFTIRPMGGRESLMKDPRDVWWMREHDPRDPYCGRGVGTAGALGDELETDEYMAIMAKSRFFNRSTPEAIVGFLGAQGPMGQEAVDKFMNDLAGKHRGPTKAGQLHGTTGDVRVQQLSYNMVESQYVEGRQFLRDTAIQVFGVPPEMLGVLENANRSTIDAAELLFTKFSTVPVLERIRAELEHVLVPEFGDDLWLDYVSPVPADREYQKGIMVAVPGAFKVDELRAQAGKGPLPDGTGDALYIPPNKAKGLDAAAGDPDRALPAHEPDLGEQIRGAFTQHLPVH